MAASPPGDPVVWAALTDPADLPAAHGLFDRLAAQRPDIKPIFTGAAPVLDVDGGIEPMPGDSAAAAETFLNRWRPLVGLWFGSTLRPSLIRCCTRGRCRMVLLHAEKAAALTRRRWLPGSGSPVLQAFTDIFPADDAAQAQLRAATLGNTRLHPPGRLTAAAPPLPVSSAEHEWVAGHLAGRPVWLAARVAKDELDVVLRAHRRVGRLAHRLVLFVCPRPDCPAQAVMDAASSIGLRALLWDDETLPDEATQVVVVPDPDMLGLFYRLSPVCFLGGSLSPGIGGTDPYEAAAVGSAIIHGPNVGKYMQPYERLTRARAAKVVTGTETLAERLTALLAPDAQAEMAHAGWEIVTEGALLSDAVVDLILETVEAAEAV